MDGFVVRAGPGRPWGTQGRLGEIAEVIQLSADGIKHVVVSLSAAAPPLRSEPAYASVPLQRARPRVPRQVGLAQQVVLERGSLSGRAASHAKRGL